MGRFVDLNKPLSDEDREYLKSRSRTDDIVVNDRRFGGLSDAQKAKEADQVAKDQEADAEEQEALRQAQADAEAESFPEHLVAKVENLTLEQLRAAAKKRGLKTSGNKEELQIRLVEYLEEQEKQKAETASAEETALRAQQSPGT